MQEGKDHSCLHFQLHKDPIPHTHQAIPFFNMKVCIDVLGWHVTFRAKLNQVPLWYKPQYKDCQQDNPIGNNKDTSNLPVIYS